MPDDPDAGAPADASAPQDGGAPPAASTPQDGGAPQDAGAPAGAPADAGAPPDAGASQEAGPPQDAGAPPDTSTTVAAGRGSGSGSGSGTNAVATPISVTLNVQCGHTSSGLRQVQGNTVMGRLQIVPSTGQDSSTASLSCMAGQLKISCTQNTGGTDTLQAAIIISGGGSGSGSGSGAPVPQIAITQNNPPADSDWQNGTSLSQSIPTPGSTDYWTMNTQPTLWQVFARGNPDDLPQRVQVETYPAYSVSGSVDDSFFKTVSKDINDSCQSVLQAMQGKVPVTICPQIQLPSGTLSVAVGWQENSDWTAVYVLTINAQINPLLGLGVKFSVNALDIAALLVDVPPSITEYLGAIVFSFEISGQISVSGSVTFKGGAVSGSLGPGGQISITVGAQAKAGNEQVVSADITASLSGGIKWSGTLDPPAAGGLVLHQTIQLTAVTGTITATLTAFGVGGSNQQQTTLWPASDPAKLPDWTLIDPSSS